MGIFGIFIFLAESSLLVKISLNMFSVRKRVRLNLSYIFTDASRTCRYACLCGYIIHCHGHVVFFTFICFNITHATCSLVDIPLKKEYDY